MADVAPTGDASRGQLVIVAALIMAVLFVGLALVLNSGIYAENVGSRETASEPKEPLEERAQLDEDLREITDRTNARTETTDSGTLADELELAFDDHRGARVVEGARTGRSVDVQLTSTADGTRLRQTNESRNFTSKDGAADWTLTEGVPDGGQFAMNVREESVYEATLDTTMAVMAESAFGVEFHLEGYDGPGDGVWRVYVFRGAATESVYAVVETPEQTFEDSEMTDRTNPDHIVNGWLNQSCSLKSQTITVRLSEATFGGSPCGEFGFYDDVDVHDVRYVNTRTGGNDRARGTYSVLVRDADYNQDAFYTVGERTDEKQPFYQSAIYAFDYTYVYRAEDTTYEAPNRTVEPGAGDPGGILWEHPRIERFGVTYLAPGDSANNSYRIDWRVTDPDGELDEVEVELIDRTVDRTEESLKERLEHDFEECIEGLNEICDLADFLDVTGISQPVNTDTLVAEANVSVSGPDASESTTLVHDAELDGEGETFTGSAPSNDSVYRVQLTVTDTSGRATTAGKHCEIEPTFCEVA